LLITPLALTAHEEFLRRLRQMSIRLRHLLFASISSLSSIVNNSLLRPVSQPVPFHVPSTFLLTLKKVVIRPSLIHSNNMSQPLHHPLNTGFKSGVICKYLTSWLFFSFVLLILVFDVMLPVANIKMLSKLQ
jgi:hypothetical protein